MVSYSCIRMLEYMSLCVMKIDVLPREFFEKRIGTDVFLRFLEINI